MPHSVYVFDAYGTLFDVHAAVRRHVGSFGPDAAAFSAHWRAKQLEYSWVRSLMNRYQDFWVLTEQALDHSFATFPAVPRDLKPDLLDAYGKLDCYREVPETIKALKARSRQLAILSNGSPEMLAGAVRAAGLDGAFDGIFSVDEIAAYKTDERVYELITTHFRVYPEAVSFQSSNRWDIAGATAFGFRTVWINRDNQPDEYLDLPPSAVLTSLDGLLSL